jgi:hypothetical protein
VTEETYAQRRDREAREKAEEERREEITRRARCPDWDSLDGCGHPLVWHPDKDDQEAAPELGCRGRGCDCTKTREEILNLLLPIDAKFTVEGEEPNV